MDQFPDDKPEEFVPDNYKKKPGAFDPKSEFEDYEDDGEKKSLIAARS